MLSQMDNNMIRSRIKLRHIQCFSEAVRQGSLKRAADRLNLTQPAMSKTLKELEQILGKVLLIRNRAGVSLTDAGQVFAHFADMSLSALDHGLDGIAQLDRAGKRAEISIGALPSVAAALLPRAVAEFERLSPTSSLRILDGPIAYLVDQLRNGSVMQNLSFTQLYQEEVDFVVRPGHPLLEAPRLEDIVNWPVIYPPAAAAIRPLVERFLIGHGIGVPPKALETVSGAFGRVYTRESDAVWIISRGVVWNELAEGRLMRLPFDTGLTRGPVGLLRREDADQGAEEGLFMTALTRAIGQMRLAE
jgi:LysR family pca operon transcriptional activator